MSIYSVMYYYMENDFLLQQIFVDIELVGYIKFVVNFVDDMEILYVVL